MESENTVTVVPYRISSHRVRLEPTEITIQFEFTIDTGQLLVEGVNDKDAYSVIELARLGFALREPLPQLGDPPWRVLAVVFAHREEFVVFIVGKRVRLRPAAKITESMNRRLRAQSRRRTTQIPIAPRRFVNTVPGAQRTFAAVGVEHVWCGA